MFIVCLSCKHKIGGFICLCNVIIDMVEKCPTCGRTFKRITMHWNSNETHRPQITERQHEILTGMMLGDGTFYRKNGNSNPQIKIDNTRVKFLEWLKEELGWLSGDTISEYEDGRGGRKTLYTLWTKSDPRLLEYEWDTEGEGKKVFPDSINITPLILKVWYAGDGSLRWSNLDSQSKDTFYIEIGCTNEVENEEKVIGYFDGVGGVDPTWDKRGLVRFSKDDSLDVLSYMGDPIPGFEYKWCYSSREKYEELM